MLPFLRRNIILNINLTEIQILFFQILSYLVQIKMVFLYHIKAKGTFNKKKSQTETKKNIKENDDEDNDDNLILHQSA